jgi:Calpain family cysteine protease
MRWAPNPIALARIAVSSAEQVRAWPDSWQDVEALFGEAYKADARAVLYGSGDAPALIDMFDAAAAQVPAPQPLESLLDLPAVRALAARLSNPEWLPRLLPLIVPVSDVDFGPPGTGVGITTHPHIGSYKRIGALEVDGVSWLDPEQGSTSDCYLIAAMIAIAWARPRKWREVLTSATHGSKTVGALSVAFHNDNPGKPDPDPFDVLPLVPLDAKDKWIYAHSASHDETWPALIELAFVMLRCHRQNDKPTVGDYRSISNDMFPRAAARTLVGGSMFAGHADALNKPFAMVAGRCDQSVVKTPTIASTRPVPVAKNDFVEAKLIRNHAYAVLGLMAKDGRNFVVLRNPFGHNDRIADSPDGAWPAGASHNGGASVVLGSNGVFAISEQRFNACFLLVDGVEVPSE